jgi:hypothetical protein
VKSTAEVACIYVDFGVGIQLLESAFVLIRGPEVGMHYFPCTLHPLFQAHLLDPDCRIDILNEFGGSLAGIVFV